MKIKSSINNSLESRGISTKVIEEILQRRLIGSEIKDLALQFNLKESRVKLILQSNGYDCDSQNLPNKLKVSQKDINKLKIQIAPNKNKSTIPSNKYQKDSMNNESLAKKFNISLDDVNQFFERIRK